MILPKAANNCQPYLFLNYLLSRNFSNSNYKIYNFNITESKYFYEYNVHMNINTIQTIQENRLRQKTYSRDHRYTIIYCGEI